VKVLDLVEDARHRGVVAVLAGVHELLVDVGRELAVAGGRRGLLVWHCGSAALVINKE